MSLMSLMGLYEFLRVFTNLYELRTEIGDAAEVEDVADVEDVETAEVAVELEVEAVDSEKLLMLRDCVNRGALFESVFVVLRELPLNLRVSLVLN